MKNIIKEELKEVEHIFSDARLFENNKHYHQEKGMLGAITGGIAEAYYEIPKNTREKAMTFLDQRLTKILIEFKNKYEPKVI